MRCCQCGACLVRTLFTQALKFTAGLFLLGFNEEAPAHTSRPQERPEQPEVSTPAVRAAFLTALSGATAHRLYVRRYLLKFLMQDMQI